jgi:uncharacterized protein
MLFDVLRELREPMGAVNEFELREPQVKAGDVTIRDLEGTVRFVRTDRGLLTRLRASGLIDEECSRCLTPTQSAVHVDFEEEYVPEFDAVTGSAIRLSEEEQQDVFRIDPRWELDLREGLRQYILMNEPAKPLCKADCAGLCPVCGADMNAGPHECEPPADERWSALTGLGETNQRTDTTDTRRN